MLKKHDEHLRFVGEDLQIAGHPERKDNQTVEVTLRSQQPEEFAHNVRNHVKATCIMTRRLLGADGIGISLIPGSIEIRQKILTLRAQLTHLATNSPYGLLEHLREGNFIAKPYHLHGKEPMNVDEILFALEQGFLSIQDRDIQFLPDNVHETNIALHTEGGLLRYYAENAEPIHQVSERLVLEPGEIDEHSRPLWRPEGIHIARQRELIHSKIHGLKAPFFSTLIHAQAPGMSHITEKSLHSLYTFDVNMEEVPLRQQRVHAELYDMRRQRLKRPRKESLRTGAALHSYDQARRLFDHLRHVTGQQREVRPVALVNNTKGMDHLLKHTDSIWMRTKEMHHLMKGNGVTRRPSSMSPEPNRSAANARNAPETLLLAQARELGFDGGGTLVCETFPEHAVLDSLLGEDAHAGCRQISTLLFRHASGKHGPYFSGHDFTSLYNFIDQGTTVHWAHDDISHKNGDTVERGTLLELIRLKRYPDEQGSIMFVPIDRKQECLSGIHVAFYGTARTLQPQYIAFMEQLFALLQKQDNHEKPYVIHSGGGPNTSTMGIANRLARECGFLSIGHVLGVKKEPANEYLDGTMPFRGDARDVRQGNMAKVADVAVVLEGGGGTREERGITQTDLAIARETPFPLILVGTDFYAHEYLQYLHEVAEGTLDRSVLECISLLDVDRPEDAAPIIEQFRESGKVLSIIPPGYEKLREDAVAKFEKIMPIRRQAWKQE